MLPDGIPRLTASALLSVAPSRTIGPPFRMCLVAPPGLSSVSAAAAANRGISAVGKKNLLWEHRNWACSCKKHFVPDGPLGPKPPNRTDHNESS